MEPGYAGKILRVDLSSGDVSFSFTKDYADRFLGGRGVAAKIYWDETSPSNQAFAPENPLIYVTGPFAGFPGLAGSRFQVCGKSPAITPEIFCYADIGGRWGVELKLAGFDGLVVKGKAKKPVYILIQDDLIEIKDASNLWGKDSVVTRQIIKNELGSNIRVLATGIAGENLVPFATILSEDNGSGTSGFAAVMGSKNLKAIAVRGSGKVTAAKPEQLNSLTTYLRNLVRGRTIQPYIPSERPPIPDLKRQACWGCVGGCNRSILTTDNQNPIKFMCQASGFYIEAALRYYRGWNNVALQATGLCDRYGLDTMVVAGLIKWLLKCHQKGILTDENTGIPISKYGSEEFIQAVIEKTSRREGFGAVLAQGPLKAAKLVGQNSKDLIGDFVLPSTGEEYPYDPRVYITTGLFYATEPKKPIQQLHEISWLVVQWVAWKHGIENAYVSTDLVHRIAKRFWGSEVAADFSTYEGKALAAKMIQDRQYAKESLILCDWSWPIAHTRYTPDHSGDPTIESKLLSAITGPVIDEHGLNHIGERVFNLQRGILVREGHGKKADAIPDFSYSVGIQQTPHNLDCLVPGKEGALLSRKGMVVEKDKFEIMRDEYYRYRGWDVATGLQLTSKLEQLGLKDVADVLEKSDLAIS